ncbi:MAG: BamA/TamA family outer membrane protein [Gemmatimonadota bacterium]|nr:BamA/TamA family outer membrane protein [Gemmatimonadota bacterium]
MIPALLVGQLALADSAGAQDTTPPDSALDQDGSTIVPLPILFYQPETKFGFGLLGTYYFRPGATPRSVPPSEIGGFAIYTTRKQIVTAVSTRLYLSGGALRLAGGLSATKFPTTFWGIGNATPDSAEEDYTPLTFAILGEVLREVAHGWFVGGRVQVAHRTLREVSDTGQLVTGTVPGSEDGRIIEATLLLTRDVRDNTIYPTAGQYHQVGLLGAATALGSDFGYAGVRVDFRGYLSPGKRHVLALRAYGDIRSGTPPFDLLPQLGGDVLLRGYYQGRFRDLVLVALQAEYRLPVIWRIGLVGFAETGRVAPRLGDLGFDGLKTSVGGGLRFLLAPKEGVNIRADYGWGFDVGAGGFYLAIGEAF